MLNDKKKCEKSPLSKSMLLLSRELRVSREIFATLKSLAEENSVVEIGTYGNPKIGPLTVLRM